LFVWDKCSYTGSFLMLFPCKHVLQPQLVYLLWDRLTVRWSGEIKLLEAVACKSNGQSEIFFLTLPEFY
jgi:hypothetical protein